jgi:sRNA-binding protein
LNVKMEQMNPTVITSNAWNGRALGRIQLFALLLAVFLGELPGSARAQADEGLARPLGEKGASVFSDDFSTDRFGSVWTERIKSAGVENGVMYARQTTKAHGAVATAKLDLPDGNLICECRVQIEHNATLAFSFDDMKYPGSVAGHIARVTIEQQEVNLHDDKEGAMNRKLLEQRKSDDAATQAKAEEEIKRHTLRVPMTVETHAWHTFSAEIVEDQMRVTLDGKPIGVLKSPGLAHATKPDLKISLSGKQALIGDLHVWAVKTTS